MSRCSRAVSGDMLDARGWRAYSPFKNVLASMHSVGGPLVPGIAARVRETAANAHRSQPRISCDAKGGVRC